MQRPLATVVIGGIVSSNIQTLSVPPLIYHLVHRKDEQAAFSHQPAELPEPLFRKTSKP